MKGKKLRGCEECDWLGEWELKKRNGGSVLVLGGFWQLVENVGVFSILQNKIDTNLIFL